MALLLILVFATLGIGDGARAASPSRLSDTTPATSTTTAIARMADAAHGTTVRLSARSDNPVFRNKYAVADELRAGMVLRVRADGFEPNARGHVVQCVHLGTIRCGNAFPVQFDNNGTAYFQYEMRDDFHASVVGAGGCRAHAARCTLVVQHSNPETTGVIDTVFYDVAPAPGVIRVRPRARLVDGDVVTVDVSGYPPDTQVNATLCAAPAATGSERCGSPGPSATLLIGPDGTASTTLTVGRGPVGSRRIECERDSVCGISVGSDEVFTRAPVVPISFAPPPGADYDSTRLVSGLALAALLIGLAVSLVRRTDWSPVGEAAAPEIDEAEFADLDAIIAALPPEDDEELVPGR